MTEKIRVLVVDDSALMRNLVSKIINAADDMEVAATAMNGRFALDKLRRVDADVIVLDLEMPEMDGLTFLKERRAQGITAPVIILSSVAERGARVTMDALSLGASDFITKPSGSVSHDIQVVSDQLQAMIRAFAKQNQRDQRNRQERPGHPTGADAPKRITPPSQPQQRPAARRRTPKKDSGSVDIVAIGISTGGPNALRLLLPDIAVDIDVPIVVVQHMPPGFTTEFARSLDRVCALEVKEAGEGDVLKPGRVLIAPGDHHLTVKKRSLTAICHLHQYPPRNGHRPSVDVLFDSVAKEFGRHALAVIMTGMGKDGATEIGAIYDAGGVTIGQDEASSIVYGMPRVAFENGYLHRQVSLQAMAADINRTVAAPRSERS